MPHMFESKKIRLPRELDRRVKLSEADKDKIRNLYREGVKIRAIARAFEGKCTRRAIQFVLFPERLETVKRQFRERRKDGRYYDKDRHRMAIKKTRRYKYSLGLMIPKDKLTRFMWYHGKGRVANLGFWDGKNFYTIGRYYDSARMYTEGHYQDGGTFRPFKGFSTIPKGFEKWAEWRKQKDA